MTSLALSVTRSRCRSTGEWPPDQQARQGLPKPRHHWVAAAATLVGKAAEDIESRTNAAAEFAVARLGGATEDVERRATAVAEAAATRLAVIGDDIESRTNAAAEFAAARLGGATNVRDTPSSSAQAVAMR